MTRSLTLIIIYDLFYSPYSCASHVGIHRVCSKALKSLTSTTTGSELTLEDGRLVPLLVDIADHMATAVSSLSFTLLQHGKTTASSSSLNYNRRGVHQMRRQLLPFVTNADQHLRLIADPESSIEATGEDVVGGLQREVSMLRSSFLEVCPSPIDYTHTSWFISHITCDLHHLFRNHNKYGLVYYHLELR